MACSHLCPLPPAYPSPPVQVAIVRQLESELHIDGQHTTVDDLRRFVPTLWHVKVRGLGLPLMMLKNGLHPFGSVLPPGCLSLYCRSTCGTLRVPVALPRHIPLS